MMKSIMEKLGVVPDVIDSAPPAVVKVNSLILENSFYL